MIYTSSNDIKERLSIGVVTLVAARAGCMLTEIAVDRESVDVTIRPVKGEPVCIDAQLKSSSSIQRDATHLIFDLPVKNNNDLCAEVVGNARILVVLDLDPDDQHWLACDAETIVARRLAYWTELLGQAPSNNKTTKRVRVPLDQAFTPASLVQIMHQRHANLLAHVGGVS